MKLLNSYFSPVTGVATVTLMNKQGKYIGYARVHPKDKNTATELAGCHLAEQRAWIKYFKQEIHKNKIKLKAIEDLKKDIEVNCSDLYPSEYATGVSKRIYFKTKQYNKIINFFKEQIDFINKNIKEDLRLRAKLNKKDKGK